MNNNNEVIFQDPIENEHQESVFSDTEEVIVAQEKEDTDHSGQSFPEKETVKIKFSVKFKFSLLAAFLITIITILISFYLLNNIKTNLLTEMKLRAKLFTENLSKSLAEIYEDDVSRHEIIIKNRMTLKDDIVSISVFNLQNDLIDSSDAEKYNKILLSKVDENADKNFEKLDSSLIQKITDNLFFQEYNFQNDERFYYLTQIKIINSVLGCLKVDFTKKYIIQKIKTVQSRIILFIIISLIIVIALSYILTSYLIKPLKKLSQGVQIIGNGNLNHKISIETNDELSQLASEFNNMTDKLIKAQRSLIEKERFEEQLEIARNIQKNLLPDKFPHLQGIEISAYYKPAKGVSGDYYDIMYSPQENILNSIIADVSGKGVPAALVMVMIRTIFQTTYEIMKSPDQAIKNINKGITGKLTGDKFATAFYYSYNLNSGLLEYSNAAHSPLIVYKKKDNQIFELDTHGVPVGIDKESTYEVNSTQLQPGDIIVTYTDGITEAMDENSEMFKLSRLKQLIIKNAAYSAEEINNLIIKEINSFIGRAPQHDDMTLVILKVKEKVAAPKTKDEKSSVFMHSFDAPFIKI